MSRWVPPYLYVRITWTTFLFIEHQRDNKLPRCIKVTNKEVDIFTTDRTSSTQTHLELRSLEYK